MVAKSADSKTTFAELYVNGVRDSGVSAVPQLYEKARDVGGFVWLNLVNPPRSAVAQLAKTFSLSALVVEQITSAKQRPKIVQSDRSALAVFKTTQYVRHGDLTPTSEIVETGHVVVVLGEHFVLTVHRDSRLDSDVLRKRLERQPEWLAEGPWVVLHAVLDVAVDEYGNVTDQLEDDIDDVEASVFSHHKSDVARIYQLKREIVEFRRAVMPLERPLERILTSDINTLPPLLLRHFADIVDHHRRVIEQIAGFDDLLTSILSASLTQVNIQQNNDMRKISAWAAIAAVQTTIAGIYGMNFEHMPETDWVIGYPLVLVVMVVVAWYLYRLFRRSGWL